MLGSQIIGASLSKPHIYHTAVKNPPYIYTNKAKRNLFVCLFACLSGMASHALYGMAPCFGHRGVTFDVENDKPGPSSLRGHFEATRGHFRVC